MQQRDDWLTLNRPGRNSADVKDTLYLGRQLERSLLSGHGQPQMEAAGRRSTVVAVPEQPQSARPPTQPGLSPGTPGHSAPLAPVQVCSTLWAALWEILRIHLSCALFSHDFEMIPLESFQCLEQHDMRPEVMIIGAVEQAMECAGL